MVEIRSPFIILLIPMKLLNLPVVVLANRLVVFGTLRGPPR